MIDDFDSFDLEPFTIQELKSRDQQDHELFGPCFKDLFMRLQQETTPLSSEQEKQQSHDPRIRVSSHILIKPQPQVEPYIDPDIPKDANPDIANFLITTPRIQVSCRIRQQG